METQRKILLYALSCLLRRRGKNIAIGMVFSLLVAVLASILFLSHSLKIEAAKVLDEAPELIVQKLAGGRHDLIPADYIHSIRQLYGVGRVVSRYWGYYYDRLTKSNYTVIGINNLGDTAPPGIKFPRAAGECAIGRGVAGLLSASVGDDITLTNSKGANESFSVVGVFSSDSSLLTNDLIILTNDAVIDLFGMPPGKATDIVVEVNNDFELPYVITKIREMMPDTRPIMKAEILRTYDSVLHWRSGVVLIMFSGALIAFCILAWDKATGLSAEERQEIGILKAVGWDTSDILALKFWEGVILAGTSFLAGIILAYAHVFFFGASFFVPVLKGWSILFPEFRLIPYIEPYQIASLLLFTVVPYIACTIIPSWTAAITDPDAVVR